MDNDEETELPNFPFIVSALLDFADDLEQDDIPAGALMHQAKVLQKYIDANLRSNGGIKPRPSA